jgi:hypothetical protein
MRQLQLAYAGALRGTSLTVAPEGLNNLYSLLNTAGGLSLGVRPPAPPAAVRRDVGASVADDGAAVGTSDATGAGAGAAGVSQAQAAMLAAMLTSAAAATTTAVPQSQATAQRRR